MYAPLNTVGWPDWYLRKSCSAHKTSSPGSRWHSFAFDQYDVGRTLVVTPAAGPPRNITVPAGQDAQPLSTFAENNFGSSGTGVFTKHSGMNCVGSSADVLRDYAATACDRPRIMRMLNS